MTSPSSVLFDIDGTLVDSTYHHALAWQRSFARHDLTVPMWRIHRSIGVGGDRLVALVAGEEAEARVGQQVRDAWREEYAALVGEVRPLPGAADLLRAVADQGHLVGLASAGERAFSQKAVEALGVQDVVAASTSADDLDESGDSKPEPDILGTTLDLLSAGLGGRPVERAAVVGDTPYDVEAAHRIGLRCVGVLSGGYGREELDSAGAALVVADLSELIAVDWGGLLAPPRDSAHAKEGDA